MPIPLPKRPNVRHCTHIKAAIAGAERGNWRDLKTVFEFAGIGQRNEKGAG
jgi:hypothetical protein